MYSVEEIVAIAAAAASSGRTAIFRSLAIGAGVVGRPGGWIYLPGGTKPVAHGWQAFAKALSGPRVGWTGKDVLVEMSKRSATPADVDAAHAAALGLNGGVVAQREQAGDDRGMHLGPGHVAPATIARAYDEALAEGAARTAGVVVAFDRIGRHGTTSLRIDSADPAEIGRQVRAHIRTNRLIASREYDVDVDVPGGVILLDGGRFGRGSISRPAAAPTLPEVEQQGDYYARFPQPRADRLAAAFEAFVELADPGGPGTSKGLIAAAERATTVTERHLVSAIAQAGIPSGSLTAIDVRRVIESLGFAIN